MSLGFIWMSNSVVLAAFFSWLVNRVRLLVKVSAMRNSIDFIHEQERASSLSKLRQRFRESAQELDDEV